MGDGGKPLATSLDSEHKLAIPSQCPDFTGNALISMINTFSGQESDETRKALISRCCGIESLSYSTAWKTN